MRSLAVCLVDEREGRWFGVKQRQRCHGLIGGSRTQPKRRHQHDAPADAAALARVGSDRAIVSELPSPRSDLRSRRGRFLEAGALLSAHELRGPLCSRASRHRPLATMALSIGHLLLYSPLLSPADRKADGEKDEDAQEAAQVAFYYSNDQVGTRDGMLRSLGLAKGLGEFVK